MDNPRLSRILLMLAALAFAIAVIVGFGIIVDKDLEACLALIATGLLFHTLAEV